MFPETGGTTTERRPDIRYQSTHGPWPRHRHTGRSSRSRWKNNNASNCKFTTGKRAIPWRGPGAQYQRERREEKATEKKNAAKEKDNVQEPEQEQAQAKGEEETKQKEQKQGPGQGQGQRERNKPSKHASVKRVSDRRKGKRITSGVSRLFASLVQGATETDLCLLLDEGSWRTGVYTYEHEAKRCITCESLPWPVAWVLGRFNLKAPPCVQASTCRIRQRAMHWSRAQSVVAMAPRQQKGSWTATRLGESTTCLLPSTQNVPRRSSDLGFRISAKRRCELSSV